MIPRALELVDSWRERRAQTGHLLVALDFDGTIAPIVQRPQEAYMLDPARTAIESLLERPDTDVAIVSGRALNDLRDRCALEGVYYSGNHGLQIDGPGVHATRPDAVSATPRISEIAQRLAAALKEVPGVYIEDKELTLSVHSRRVEDEAERDRVQRIVEDIAGAAGDGIRLTFGKRVVEVRPDVDWHKGQAILFLLERIAEARRTSLFAIYIGDDVTDEDAFAALHERGAGIVVAESPPRETAATAWAASPDEVVVLLEALARP